MSRERCVQKHFELSPYENAILLALTKKTGLKQSDVIRELLLGNVLIEAPGATFYNAIDEIRKIGTNINQIAHVANATGIVDVSAFDEERKKLDALILDIKRIVLEPRRKNNIDELVFSLEYMLWKTEEDEIECREIQERLKALNKRAER